MVFRRSLERTMLSLTKRCKDFGDEPTMKLFSINLIPITFLLVSLCSVSVCQPTLGYVADREELEKQFQQMIAPLLKKTCLDCHQGDEASGGLALNHFPNFQSILRERGTWNKVIQRVRIGDMPPMDADPLSDAERKKMVDWLQSAMNDIDCGKTPNPGAVTLRRLNRSEYQNTIEDLLGVKYAPAADFPGDDVGYGFDNIGDVLTLPPILMEKYLKAAEEISQQAILAGESGPMFEVAYKGEQLQSEGGVNKNGGAANFYSNGKATLSEQTPWAGSYTLEITATATKAGKDPAKLLVSKDGKKVREYSITGTNDKPELISVPMKLSAGKRSITLEFTNDFYVEAKDGKPAEDRNLTILDVRLAGRKKPESVDASKLPASHKMIMKSMPTGELSLKEAAKKNLFPLVYRAYRRTPKPEEVDRLSNLVAKACDDGESFEGGMQLALQAILISPHFLFKIEQPNENSTEKYAKVTDFELATRLSYFLWSTMPDDRLLQLASKKELSKPDVLSSEVKRMIQSAKSDDFVRNFAGQWLTLRKLDSFNPDKKLFPQWTDETKELVRRETFRFFAEVMRKDMSILTFLDGDFTFVNEDLAKFYGITDFQGTGWKMVSTKDKPRRGLLTHASVLAVTSNPTRTSPVKRGRWVLDNLLGTPPPPAPPNVPELEKSELVGTLRERMEQHRVNPACAGCHKLMDPIGFALENYDAIGRWRDKDSGQKIDTSGVLPDGEAVKNAGDLIRTLRKSHADEFTRCLTEKMLTFATGRGLEYFDRCAVDKIATKVKSNDYQFSVLITEIVLSDPFQKRGEKE